MTAALLLSLTLVASGAPADLAPAAPEVEAPAPAQQMDTRPIIVSGGALVTDPLYVGLGDPIAPAYCIADCNPSPDVDCTGANCSAVDRNCSVGQRGYVSCDGQIEYCPECDPGPGTECTDGDYMIVPTGGCCGSRTSYKERYRCENGWWVLQQISCMPDPSCPI